MNWIVIRIVKTNIYTVSRRCINFVKSINSFCWIFFCKAHDTGTTTYISNFIDYLRNFLSIVCWILKISIGSRDSLTVFNFRNNKITSTTWKRRRKWCYWVRTKCSTTCYIFFIGLCFRHILLPKFCSTTNRKFSIRFAFKFQALANYFTQITGSTHIFLSFFQIKFVGIYPCLDTSCLCFLKSVGKVLFSIWFYLVVCCPNIFCWILFYINVVTLSFRHSVFQLLIFNSNFWLCRLSWSNWSCWSCWSCCRRSVSYRSCVTSRRSSWSWSCFRCWSSISCWRFRCWCSWDYSRSWSALSSFCHPTIYRCRLWSRWIRGWYFIRRYCFAITKHSNGAKSNDSNCAIYFIFTNRTVTFCLAIVIEHARSFLHFYN